MLKLLLGEDIYTKQQYLDKELAKFGGEVTKFQADSQLPKLGSLSGASLFGSGGAYVFFDCLKAYETEELTIAKESSIPIYFIETSLDKRLKKSKEILEIADVKEFSSPSLDKAPSWIIAHGENIGINIQPQAATELANRLIGDSKSGLSTISAHNELLKLESFANGKIITKEMVQELTPADLNIDLFRLLDQIGNRNKNGAIELLNQYYDGSSEDNKIATIKLVGLLSEQLRSLLITKEFEAKGINDKEILSVTGWKSTRLYVMKKLSKNFSAVQLTSALTKFYSLDKEIKSSGMPPRVIVGMIVASL